MLSNEAERRAYLGEDPAEIVADELEAQAVRDAVATRFPQFATEVLEGRPLDPWATEEMAYWLYPWSRQYLEGV